MTKDLRCSPLIFRIMPALLLAVLLGGCGRNEREVSENVDLDTAVSPAENARLMRLAGEFFRDNLVTYILRFEDVRRVPADSLAALMPADSQMLADVLLQAEREMQRLGVTSDARWSALSDSLRTDLAIVTRLRGEALRVFLLDHQQRVRRLLDWHAEMMAPIDSMSSKH